MQGALGVPGVEGTFGDTCEGVLAELRGHGDLLTDLVASFVTDPLVEWSFVREDSAASKVSLQPLESCCAGCVQPMQQLGSSSGCWGDSGLAVAQAACKHHEWHAVSLCMMREVNMCTFAVDFGSLGTAHFHTHSSVARIARRLTTEAFEIATAGSSL